jgi:hypothetical protein
MHGRDGQISQSSGEILIQPKMIGQDTTFQTKIKRKSARQKLILALDLFLFFKRNILALLLHIILLFVVFGTT